VWGNDKFRCRLIVLASAAQLVALMFTLVVGADIGAVLRERERERNKSIDIDIYIYINLELFPLLEVV
jgi:hypothetical protein